MSQRARNILFFIFVLGLAIYLLATNAIGKLGFGNFKLSTIFPSYNASSTASSSAESAAKPWYYYEARKPPPPPVYATSTGQTTSAIYPSDIPAGFTPKDLSPYFHKVRVQISFPGFGIVYPQIYLNPNLGANESADIAGWTIKTNRGTTLPIPRGVEHYDAGFPAAGDIVLRQGDYAYLYVLQSPNGVNFRLNECSGYLNNDFNFVPSLPMSCPYPDRGEISRFSGRCQSYILSLSNCETPTPADLNSFSNPVDNGCHDYLSALNYQGCYANHYLDSDFLSHEWRIWFGEGFPIDQAHDRLLLLDARGLLVDEYSY